MESRTYIFAVALLLTLIELSITFASSEPISQDPATDEGDELGSHVGRINSLFSLLPDEDEQIYGYPGDKRSSLFRFGKRAAPFRFGKRGSILRFGKRPSAVYDVSDYDVRDFVPAELDSLSDDSMGFANKRSSLFRFGKRNPEKEKKPHTPWRFGRYLYENEDNE